MNKKKTTVPTTLKTFRLEHIGRCTPNPPRRGSSARAGAAHVTQLLRDVSARPPTPPRLARARPSPAGSGASRTEHPRRRHPINYDVYRLHSRLWHVFVFCEEEILR
ncbi:hypothetical protein EVAR_31674_1 [Eumeta japonica]|uniref:Uncharacterized protein n=1 Tax=Eumeta variegata TaxID=151549 RepID=A0A4C1VT81_EUMVA|nr:hypothetical protein EVAR_31674_1 [Eumeta japonica]